MTVLILLMVVVGSGSGRQRQWQCRQRRRPRRCAIATTTATTTANATPKSLSHSQTVKVDEFFKKVGRKCYMKRESPSVLLRPNGLWAPSREEDPDDDDDIADDVSDGVFVLRVSNGSCQREALFLAEGVLTGVPGHLLEYHCTCTMWKGHSWLLLMSWGHC